MTWSYIDLILGWIGILALATITIKKVYFFLSLPQVLQKAEEFPFFSYHKYIGNPFIPNPFILDQKDQYSFLRSLPTAGKSFHGPYSSCFL